jgi:alkylation response protein AidB-like acyl-CoA dehydrogenase
MCAYMDERLAAEVYSPAGAITCGVFAPLGRAVRVPGGFRVSGRWPFASGCEHAQWRMGGVVFYDGDRPELLPNGTPHPRSILFRAAETTILDTWDVSGLRGTGSHDLEVRELVVPAERCFSLVVDEPRGSTAIYQLPLFGVLGAVIAAVMLGIARAALEVFVELARVKHPSGGQRTIAHRESIQLDTARAEAKLRAARLLVLEAAAAGDRSLGTRTGLRLAACHAAAESAAAVDLVYNAAGGTAIYSSHPLQRHFRDVHVATQHMMVGTGVMALVGRSLLGLDIDITRF